MFDYRNMNLKKTLVAEPWLSTVENCRWYVWVSGKSRSLSCLRVLDGKKVFHNNTGGSLAQYDGKISVFFG